MESNDILSRYLCRNENSSSNSDILLYFNESEIILDNSLPLKNVDQDQVCSSKISFCTKENVENSVVFLSQEVKLLGYPSIQNGTRSLNVITLINVAYELLQHHKSNQKLQEELENRNSRLQSDIDYLHVNQTRLKNVISQSEKNAAVIQERERQSSDQNKSLQQKLKNEKEETKKLNGLLHQREVQYQHEIRKRDKEVMKLKDRLNQILADRSQSHSVGIEILNNLPRKDGTRSKWKTNHLENKQEEEMYKAVIKDYENRHRVLVEENIILRHLLFQVNEKLSSIFDQMKPWKLKMILNNNEVTPDISSNANEVERLDALTEGHFNMPLQTVQEIMQNNLMKKFQFFMDFLNNSESYIFDKNSELVTKFSGVFTKQDLLLQKLMNLWTNDVISSDKKTNIENEKLAINKEWEDLFKSVNGLKLETSTPDKNFQFLDIESTVEIR